MKIQKENCVGTFIKASTIRQKELAIGFYEKRGFILAPFEHRDAPNKKNWYVSVYNGELGWIVFGTNNDVARLRLKEIDLFRRNRPKFPRRMLVSENAIDWYERKVYATVKNLGEKKARYISPYWPSEDETAIIRGELYLLRSWRYAKEIK